MRHADHRLLRIKPEASQNRLHPLAVGVQRLETVHQQIEQPLAHTAPVLGIDGNTRKNLAVHDPPQRRDDVPPVLEMRPYVLQRNPGTGRNFAQSDLFPRLLGGQFKRSFDYDEADIRRSGTFFTGFCGHGIALSCAFPVER